MATTATTSVETVLQWFRGSPAGRQIQAAADAQRERCETVQRLRAAQSRQEKEGMAIAEKIRAAEQAIVALRAKFESELAAASAKLAGLQSEQWSIGTAVDRLEAELRRTAPAAIEETLSELRELEVETRRALRSDRQDGFVDRGAHYERTSVFRSNRGAVDARLAALRVAREKVEALKLTDLAGEQLDEQIAEIVATVPDDGTLDVLVQVP